MTPKCDTCGLEITTGMMSLLCPRQEKCELWPEEGWPQEWIETELTAKHRGIPQGDGQHCTDNDCQCQFWKTGEGLYASPSGSPKGETQMGDKSRGLYNKFNVTRNDGTSAPGSKHDGCEYFVLDLTHDKHAKAALLAYAESCKAEYPLLSHDLRATAIFATSDNPRSVTEGK